LISDAWVANDGDGRDSNPLDPGDWTNNNDCYSGYIGRNSSWHGTHVAGTIGAATNNGSGVAGLNWVSKIIPVRVLGRCGGFTSDIADGIRWAAGLAVTGVPTNPYPAKVINMSLGGLGACDTTYQSAVNAAYNAGSVVVVAAGNSSANASGYRPGNCDNVVTVAATNRNGNLADYSNYGATVEISAPGGDTNPITSDGVLSTLDSGTTSPSSDSYVYYQGTSMAAPHVAGIASLMLSVDPSLTPAQVLSVMQSTVTAFPVGSSCTTSNCGSGIINAGAAVAALGTPTPVLSPINNSDGDGNYTVSWAPGTLAKEEITTIHAPTAAYSIYLPIVLKNYDGTTYTLEEDDNAGFTSPTAVYMGTNTSWDATGKAPGTYFYRVKASNDEGDSGWSNIESVTVGSSSPGILNGDFESGSSNWVEFSTHGWDIIITGAPVTPRSGTYLAWLGGDYDDLSYVQQNVTISASTPYLVYWHWIGSEDVCGFDFGSVKVGNIVVDSYNLCSDENTGGWVKHSVNLGAYVGQTVTLQIRAETDSSGNSNLFVDDVSLQASASVANDFVTPHQIQDVVITRDKWK
jgi:serine protease